MSEKSCANCIQRGTFTDFKGRERWSCENEFGQVGWPVACDPPYDEACENWTDDPKEKNAPLKAMHEFTDRYWEVQE